MFIESKNSEFDFVALSFPSKNSTASVVPMGFKIRRNTNVLAKSVGLTLYEALYWLILVATL